MKRSSIPEYLLREVWKDHANFLVPDLRLRDGASIHVLEPGIENEHRGGPDFLKARVSIGDVAVSGDVELHITPKHWDAHHHSEDSRYSNVMLHVVLEPEEEDHAHGINVPTLILRDNLAFDRRDLWEKLFERVYDRSPELACFPHNLTVPMRFKRRVLEKFGEARLDELIDRVLLSEEADVSEARLLERVYQLTMDALGYSQNRIPFRELSSLVPLSRLRFIRESFGSHGVMAFEALYFGVAGLLPAPSNDFDQEANEHIIELQSLWHAIQLALSLPEVLTETDWAFFRIRPLNSPYRRIALAALVAYHYFSDQEWSFSDRYFENGPEAVTGSSPFWERRTSFSQQLAEAQSLLGEERHSAIWLNVILPARIARLRLERETTIRKSREKELRKEWGDVRTRSSAKYLNILTQELLESENVNSVRSEQGGLTLLRNFCEKNRCYECPIGNRLVENGWKPGREST